MEEKKYQIGGKTYIQRPLVLGQIKQLMALLRGVVIPAGITALGIIELLGDRLPEAAAIVLTEEGKSPRNKDMPRLAEETEFALNAEQILEIVEGFFLLNPLSSLLSRLAGMMESLPEVLTMPSARLSSLSSLSAPETSASKTELSGESH